MKGDKTNGLYFFQGNTMTGAAKVSILDDSNSDIISLWHMRLGHTSEKEISILSKQSLLCDQKIWKLDFCEHCIFEKQCRV